MRSEGQPRIVTTPDGARLVVTRFAAEGSARGTVVLLHGFGQNLYTWHTRTNSRSFCRALTAAGWQVEAVELRGHGASRRAGAPLAASLGDYFTGDLPAVGADLRAGALPRPLVLMGHSLGGLMAAYLALSDELGVAGVATLATPATMCFAPAFQAARMLPLAQRLLPFGQKWNRVPFTLDLLGQATAAVVRMGGERFLPPHPRAWAPGSMEPDMVQERITRGFDRTGMGVVVELAEWANTGRLAVPGVSTDLVADLARLTGPLLLVSSPGDHIVSPQMVLTARHFPRAAVQTHVVDGFGHCDLVLGKKAPEQIWKPALRWLGDLA